jgi:DNA-binding MurR/RpiR family transcriptional regulator
MKYYNVDFGSYLLHWLTMFVNTSDDMTNDVMVARALIELRDDIEDWSQDDIAEAYFISQASISRFIKKLGFKNFNEVRTALKKSQMLASMQEPAREPDYETAVHGIHDDLIRITDSLLEVKREDIETVLSEIRNHRNIWFLGSELSMSITRLMQLKLTGQGKNVYTLYNGDMQTKALETAGRDDLVIVISFGQRWFTVTDIRNRLRDDSYTSMLWTTAKDHQEENRFDRVIRIGRTGDPNLGYHCLMQFEMLINKLI